MTTAPRTSLTAARTIITIATLEIDETRPRIVAPRLYHLRHPSARRGRDARRHPSTRRGCRRTAGEHALDLRPRYLLRPRSRCERRRSLAHPPRRARMAT